MLKMNKATCDVELDIGGFENLIVALANRGYLGLKHSASCGILTTAGLDPNPDTLAACQISSRDRTLGRYSEARAVEFFFDGHNFFYLQLALRRLRDEDGGIRPTTFLLATHIYDSGKRGSDGRFKKFQQALSSAMGDVAAKKEGTRWRTSPPAPRIFRELTTSERARKGTRLEIAAAQELANRASREVLVEIKKVGVITVSQLESAIKAGREKTIDVEEVVGRLQGCDLLARQHLIVCKAQSRVIVTTSTAEKLEALLSEGTKCACGRSLREERVEEGVAPTELAIKLTDHSRWMTTLVVKELLATGLSEDDILTESTVGASEMDVLVNVLGDLVLLELKDREFSWGDSNAFSNKILRYDAADGVVITTDVVASDAKESIEELMVMARLRRTRRPGEVPVTYVEGLENLSSELLAVVEQRARTAAASDLSRMEPVANVSIPDLVLAKFKQVAVEPAAEMGG